MTEKEMVGWHHRLNRYELEQAPEDSEGQGSLACCSPWGCKKSDTTELLNNKYIYPLFLDFAPFRSPQSTEWGSLSYTVGSH